MSDQPDPVVGSEISSDPPQVQPTERRTRNGRVLTAAQWAVLDANKIPPGKSGNPLGNSNTGRFRAAVRRRLALQMRDGDEDELDQLADEVITHAKAGNKNAVAMLRELWAREDGPHQTRLAGPNGEAVTPLVLFNVDPEAMRDGRAPSDEPGQPEDSG